LLLPNSKSPPVAVLYQLTTAPVGGVARRVIVPEVRQFSNPLWVTEGAASELIVTTTGVRVVDTQPPSRAPA
jgi:hypothetical protein